MLPDFSYPAFRRAALCMVRLSESQASRKSDYRCQLRFPTAHGLVGLFDVRVFFVGQGDATAGTLVPAVLAFLDLHHPLTSEMGGTEFELLEGETVTATGRVHMVGDGVV